MAYAGARLMAAAFRSVGIDATVSPDSDAQTLELGGLHSSGEECLPHKVTLGDFLKVCRQPGFDPDKTAFFMPTAHGPCRFGQYAPYLKQQLEEMGYGDVMVISPASDNGYEGVGEHAGELMRTCWLSVICGDIAQKFLLKTRPYETLPGASDAAFDRAVNDFSDLLGRPGLPIRQRLREAVGVVEQTRDRFRAIPADYVRGRPLIGLVGEIFCRLNTFSNDDVARRVEKHGGECWLSEFSEWVWYSNWSQGNAIRRRRGRLNLEYLKFAVKAAFQRGYSRGLRAPCEADLKGYEECHNIREVLDAARPYLPPEGCLGEMVLSAGQSIFMQHHGADGVIDISPFTCMNGIVAEAVYPSISQACGDMPIRIFYFDGHNNSIENDLEIYLDVARAYQKRKPHPRVYPDYFE